MIFPSKTDVKVVYASLPQLVFHLTASYSDEFPLKKNITSVLFFDVCKKVKV